MPLPDTPYILSTDAWAFITGANYAAMRESLGVGLTDSPVFTSLTISNGTITGSSATYALTLNGDVYIYNGASGRAASLWGAENRIVGGPLVLSDSVNVNASNISASVALYKDGPNILALRNGAATPQTFRVYHTYSNAGVDVEYLQLSTSVNGFRVGTNSSGSGSSRPLFLGVGGGSQWQINTGGHIGTFGSDNLYDIGASGANRPRNLYVGSNILASGNVGIGTTNPVADLDIAETWNAPTINVTGASGASGTATITFATQAAAIPVGTTVVVAGINPSGYNGTYVVTASSVTSVSYANATTATYVTGGTVQRQFTAMKVNVTDTASDAFSKLLDLQVGGVSKFVVGKDGAIAIGGGVIKDYGSGQLGIGGGGAAFLYASGNFIQSVSQFALGPSFGSPTVFITRDADNTLALRNGGAPQTFNVYGTSGTNNTDYRRLGLYCPTNGEATIQSQFSTPLVVTGGSAPSTTATITFTAQASAFPIGSTVVVSGVTPSGYNGTYTVTASTTTSVSYTVAGALANWSSGGTAVVSGFSGTVSINGVPVGLGKGNVSSNLAIGASALAANTTGSANIGIGFRSLEVNTTGTGNMSVGSFCLLSNTTGIYNSVVGVAAMQYNTSGNYNSAIGYQSLFNNSSGSNNCAYGYESGRYLADGTTANNTPNDSLFIGVSTKALGAGQSNQIVIGHAAVGIGSNSVVLGNDSITKTALKGNVGIGTTAPGAKLTVISPFNNYPTDVNPVLSLRQPTDNTFGFDWIQDGSGTGNLNLHRVNSSVSTHVLTVSRTAGNVGIGTTSPSSKLHVAGTIKPEQATITTNATTAITLDISHAGTVLTTSSSSNVTITLPAAGTVGVGYNVMIIQGASGTITVQQGAGNTLNSFGNLYTSAGLHAAICIVCTAANTYNISGNLA